MLNYSGIGTISKYTFIEIYRSKVTALTIILACVILLVSYVAGEFTFGAPQKTTLDFGLGILSLSMAVLAIFIGSTIISKEIKDHTAYVILTRPVSRAEFLIGKISGLALLLLLNAAVLGTVSLVNFSLLGGEINTPIVMAIFLSFLESMIILLISVLISLIANVSLTIIVSSCIYILSFTLQGALQLSILKYSILRKIIIIFSYILPDFSRLNLKDLAIYSQNIEMMNVAYLFSYGLCYLFIIFILSVFLFRSIDLD
jgi:ABC-type transport system involved in multi-copper enzyme maturation permease subunit